MVMSGCESEKGRGWEQERECEIEVIGEGGKESGRARETESERGLECVREEEDASAIGCECEISCKSER